MPTAHTPTLADFAITPWAWTMAEDGETYLYALWTGKKDETPEVIHQITKEGLTAIDARLPVLVSEAFRRRKQPTERGKCINQSIRYWLNEHPLNMFTMMYKTWFLDKVNSVEGCHRDTQRIRLATSTVAIEMFEEVPLVKESHSLTETKSFDEVEAAFPGFLSRMDIAQSLDMGLLESLAYTFPLSPDVNKLFQVQTTTPVLPEFD